MAKVCPECWHDLSRKGKHGQATPVVPKNSLVRVDTGKVPEHLSSLTAMEAKLLAPFRCSRDVYLMKAEGNRQDRPNEAYQACWKGHVVAWPAASGQQLCAVFPGNPAEAAAFITVVFLSAGASDADIAAMASRSAALQVGLGVVDALVD